MPKEGISRKEYRTRKFGSWERSLELDAKVIAVGESEGIHFAFDKTNERQTRLMLTGSFGLLIKMAVRMPLSRHCFGPTSLKAGISAIVRHSLTFTGAGLDQKAAEAMLNQR
jgi:hypothetical protein